jgi:hypothetical protein
MSMDNSSDSGSASVSREDAYGSEKDRIAAIVPTWPENMRELRAEVMALFNARDWSRFSERLEAYRGEAVRAGIDIAVLHADHLAPAVVEEQGDLEQCIAMHVDVLERSRATGYLGGQASSLTNIARLEAALGNREEARTLLEEAARCYRSGGYAEGAATAERVLADLS